MSRIQQLAAALSDELMHQSEDESYPESVRDSLTSFLYNLDDCCESLMNACLYDAQNLEEGAQRSELENLMYHIPQPTLF